MGFASGFQVGQQAVERGIKLREEDQERKRLREAMGLTPQQIAPRPPTEDELGRAQAYTQAIADEDARMFATENSLENRTGLFSSNPAERPLYASADGLIGSNATYTPQMPYAGQSVGGLQYRLGDQTLNRMPTQQEIEAARYAAAANVIAERDPVAAMRMRQEQIRMQREAELAPLQLEQLKGSIAGQAQQRSLTGIQLSDAERKQKQQVEFDTGFADINKQTFEKPEERTAAILSLVERTQGVQAAEQLRASYSQNELNQISLQAKKFDEGFRQSRAKGVIPALEWFDEQNTSFKLERDPKNPFRVIQVNTDGSRTLFADAKNERELGMIVDAKAKPGGFLELAKFDLDQKKAEAAIRASDATVRYRDQQGKALDAAKGLTQKQEDFQRALDGVFEGYQAAMALGPQGRQAAAIYAREYDQLRANTPKGLRAPPSIASMNEAQRAEKPEKPVKVEDAGVQYKVGGKLMQTDGRGGLISAKGILPDDRPTVLKTVGISDNNASRLMWSDDGETVMFNNEEFDIRDKRDVEKLNKMLKDYDVMNRTIAEEARLRANPTSPSGFQGARTTGIGPASTYGVAPGAQSIYGR